MLARERVGYRLFARNGVVAHSVAHLMVERVFSEVLASKLICKPFERTS